MPSEHPDARSPESDNQSLRRFALPLHGPPSPHPQPSPHHPPFRPHPPGLLSPSATTPPSNLHSPPHILPGRAPSNTPSTPHQLPHHRMSSPPRLTRPSLLRPHHPTHFLPYTSTPPSSLKSLQPPPSPTSENTSTGRTQPRAISDSTPQNPAPPPDTTSPPSTPSPCSTTPPPTPPQPLPARPPSSALPSPPPLTTAWQPQQPWSSHSPQNSTFLNPLKQQPATTPPCSSSSRPLPQLTNPFPSPSTPSGRHTSHPSPPPSTSPSGRSGYGGTQTDRSSSPP